MSKIDSFVSPFISQQFPSFYKEDGPNFILFVRAYYEWLEQNSQAIGKSRSLLDYADIDSTEAQFLKYFKNEYLNALPENLLADKRLLVKHILELYRTKGTPRSYELLFRLLFNEDAELFVPGKYMLRPSDGEWVVPRYVETTYSPYLPQLVGKDVYNSSDTAVAIVDNYVQRVVNGKTVNVLFLSSINGKFKTGERIFSKSLVDSNDEEVLNATNAPLITGSLTSVTIQNGGADFSVGDTLDVLGGGEGAKVRVASTRNESGKVAFTLLNGGSGYTLNAAITVASTLNLTISGSTLSFGGATTLTDTDSSANGTVVSGNTTYATLINFGNSQLYSIGDAVTSDSGASGTITNVTGGGGSGATFTIGSIINKEIIAVNLDVITPYLSTTLSESLAINLVTTGNTFFVSDTITSNAESIAIDVSYADTSIKPSNGEVLSNTALGIDNITVYRADNTALFCTGSNTNLDNANLVAGTILKSSVTNSVMYLLKRPERYTVSGNAVITTVNTDQLIVTVADGFFVPGATIEAPLGVEAEISSVVEQTDWTFPARPSPLLTNLDTKIIDPLTFSNYEVGGIGYITGINPGTGYSSNPFVSVIESEIAALGIDDGFGGYKGKNAVVDSNAANARGIVTAIELTDSGLGYLPFDTVTMSKSYDSPIVVTGVTVVESDGFGTGRWRDSRGFLDELSKIQDSYYYQEFSYEVIVGKMLSTYEKLVRDLVHPSGLALFGRYRLVDYLVNDQSEAVDFSISQS